MAAAPVPLDPVDAIMTVMERAFDPRFGEAWNRRQVLDALLLGACDHAVIGIDGRIAALPAHAAAGFFLARTVFDEAELLLLAVDPACRHRGLGGRLLDRFAAAAAARGARRLFLEMRRGNPADALYEAHGFRPIGVRP
ncbi:MAG: GNAT family N-acetyltransferase, partial [Novosphingobium sp.]